MLGGVAEKSASPTQGHWFPLWANQLPFPLICDCFLLSWMKLHLWAMSMHEVIIGWDSIQHWHELQKEHFGICVWSSKAERQWGQREYVGLRPLLQRTGRHLDGANSIHANNRRSLRKVGLRQKLSPRKAQGGNEDFYQVRTNAGREIGRFEKKSRKKTQG